MSSESKREGLGLCAILFTSAIFWAVVAALAFCA
jgi:hypothetical protein